MVNTSQDEALLKEITEWRQRGAALRDRLLRERATLIQRLEEINRALAELPNPQQLELPAAAMEPPLSAAESTPSLVQQIIGKFPQGIGASEIIRQALQAKPGLTAPLVHAAIYRLGKAEKIHVTGRRGTMLYRPRVIGVNVVLGDNLQIDHVRPVQSRHPRAGKISPVSLLGQSISVLRDEGKPLHAKAIAEKLRLRAGRKINVASLVGALARATKVSQPIVCRTGENVFGLIEWVKPSPAPSGGAATSWMEAQKGAKSA